MLSGGIIGTGGFAPNHLHGWREVDGVEIVAVCDLEENRVQQVARAFEIGHAYTDATEMMRNANLDFVDIVTPASSHRKLVELAAQHRLHAICQKPFAPSMDDARAMVKACDAADVKLMIHENFRWQHALRLAGDWSSKIGSLFFGQIDFRSAYDVYANQPYLRTYERFILYDLGIHLLDLARFLMGDVTSLVCQTQRVNPCIAGEDVATVMLRMTSGATCLVTMSYSSQWSTENFPETQVHLEGTDGTVSLDRNFRLRCIHHGGLAEKDASPHQFEWAAPPLSLLQESVVAIQKHWAECLREDKGPATSGHDNLKSLELVFGAYQSAETGQPYRMGEL